jgi:hypothetical protein
MSTLIAGYDSGDLADVEYRFGIRTSRRRRIPSCPFRVEIEMLDYADSYSC